MPQGGPPAGFEHGPSRSIPSVARYPSLNVHCDPRIVLADEREEHSKARKTVPVLPTWTLTCAVDVNRMPRCTRNRPAYFAMEFPSVRRTGNCLSNASVLAFQSIAVRLQDTDSEQHRNTLRTNHGQGRAAHIRPWMWHSPLAIDPRSPRRQGWSGPRSTRASP